MSIIYLMMEQIEAYKIWAMTNNVVSVEDSGNRYEDDCEHGGTIWYWVPYENAPQAEWIYLYTDCLGGNYDNLSTPSNNNHTPEIVDIRSLTCYSVATVQQYEYLGLEFPFLDVYTPAVMGDHITTKTIVERADETSTESCSFSGSTFVQGDHGPMSIANLNASVVSATRARHGWSTYVDCSWITIMGNSFICSSNASYSEFVDHPYSQSIEVVGENCLCD